MVLSAYIHLNPLRAGIVEELSTYKWSSYPYYIGKKRKPDWLFSGDILSCFSGNAEKYAKFVMDWYLKNDKFCQNKMRGVNSFLGSRSYYREVIAKVHKEDIEINDREIPELKVIKQFSEEEIKKIKIVVFLL